MSDLYIIGGAILAAITGLLAVFGYGRRAGKQEAENDDLQEDVETARRINRVRASDNAAAAHDSLRDREPTGDL